MTKTTKRARRLKPVQLAIWGVAMPIILLLAVASVGGMVGIQQWIPQTATIYLSYLTAVIFYMLGPLPLIGTIRKYPLPIAYLYAVIWTVIFALLQACVWPDISLEGDGMLWGIIAVSATAGGILGAKLIKR